MFKLLTFVMVSALFVELCIRRGGEINSLLASSGLKDKASGLADDLKNKALDLGDSLKDKVKDKVSEFTDSKDGYNY